MPLQSHVFCLHLARAVLRHRQRRSIVVHSANRGFFNEIEEREDFSKRPSLGNRCSLIDKMRFVPRRGADVSASAIKSLCFAFFFCFPKCLPQLRRGVGHIDVIDAQRRQSVHHGVGDRRWRAIGAGLADAFDAQGIKGIRRYGFSQNKLTACRSRA